MNTDERQSDLETHTILQNVLNIYASINKNKE